MRAPVRVAAVRYRSKFGLVCIANNHIPYGKGLGGIGMARCLKCYGDIPNRATVCPNCGVSQKPRIQAEQEKQRETDRSSGCLREFLIMVAMLAIGWPLYKYFNPSEPYCPPHPSTISIPANGNAVTLEACWEEPSIYLDLRQIPQNSLSLIASDPLLQGRELKEFVRVQSHYPGLVSGNVRLEFNRDEMRRIGLTQLEIAVTPR